MDADGPHILQLKLVTDPRGNLTAVSQAYGCPFALRRAFWLYDVPADAVRGNHAHRTTNQLIVAVAGALTVTVAHNHRRSRFRLHSPAEGLFVPAGCWSSLSEFSEGCVCLTLCDTDFNEDDYIRDFNEYLSLSHATHE